MSYFSETEGGVPDRAGHWVDLDKVQAVSFTPDLDFRPILGDGGAHPGTFETLSDADVAGGMGRYV